MILEILPDNAFTTLTVSSAGLLPDESYTLWQNDTRIADGMEPGMRPGKGPGMVPPKKHERKP